MATRSCREKAQKLNEQHQLILAKLLREEDNKYCADCEAKGPRWASWNIGVFICIRCAGIHRNLGVHISRVKSVNLDQWTPEQIQCMQDMGNTKARILYEANLPENFRRPQTDQAVEFFIRDKYEKKKYYDKNAVNVASMSSSDVLQPLASSPSLQAAAAAAEKSKLEKEKEKKKEEKKREKEPEKPSKSLSAEKPQKKEDQQLDLKKSTSPKKTPEPTVDLLGLDGPADVPVTNGSTSTITSLSDDLDIFGPMISNPLPAATAAATATAPIPPAQAAASTTPPTASLAAASGDLDLFTEQTTKLEESTKKQLSKDSILSLYGTGTIQQPSAPGMFMGPTPLSFTSQPPTQFQGFPPMGVPVPTATGMMGGMLGQSVPVMGQNTGVMVGMGMPNGFVGSAQTGVMAVPQSVIGPQGGMVGQIGQPQSKFGLPQPQQQQQQQWNLPQMNQQMAGMTLTSASSGIGFGQPPNAAAGWSGSSSGQTLSTQLWK
ncbi:stromal membrane-associated protein 1 [Tachyglossus aculeatus]|uniref:stromal membrane-associated protein 1 n=1 Tax=Tachyglossus aculeatus TaxID=9261 RepID=UPI0018F621E9|nr:stromal membrane-associated protein 1 [Tachyglossus aculeatus]